MNYSLRRYQPTDGSIPVSVRTTEKESWPVRAKTGKNWFSSLTMKYPDWKLVKPVSEQKHHGWNSKLVVDWNTKNGFQSEQNWCKGSSSRSTLLGWKRPKPWRKMNISSNECRRQAHLQLFSFGECLGWISCYSVCINLLGKVGPLSMVYVSPWARTDAKMEKVPLVMMVWLQDPCRKK